MVTVAEIPGCYKSPPLQEISSRDLRGKVRGKGFGYEILTSVLDLGCSSRSGRSIRLISSFLCFRSSWWSRHPFLGNSIARTKVKGNFRRMGHYNVAYLVDNIGEGGGKQLLNWNLRKYQEKIKEVSWEVLSGQPEQGVKGVQSNGNKYCVWYQNWWSFGRCLMNYVRGHARGITLRTWGV